MSEQPVGVKFDFDNPVEIDGQKYVQDYVVDVTKTELVMLSGCNCPIHPRTGVYALTHKHQLIGPVMRAI
jgi:hypothetical protein